MAWRPTRYLIEGFLDNSKHGKVTGWMGFVGVNGRVKFDLRGDFHRDIRGAKIYFWGNARDGKPDEKAEIFMKGFSNEQIGETGDMTAGFAPCDYVANRCYLEWFSEANGRVVIELPQDNVIVIGTPIPAWKTEPICRKEQDRKMTEYMTELAEMYSKKKNKKNRAIDEVTKNQDKEEREK